MFRKERKYSWRRRFPMYRQLDAMDCGPTCLRMIARYHGRRYSLQQLRNKCGITREGVSFLGLRQAAESLDMSGLAVRLTYEQLATAVPLPCIVHWSQHHFVVVYKVTKDKVYVADPARGVVTYTRAEFMAHWAASIDGKGLTLLLEPTPRFFREDENDTDEQAGRPLGFSFLLSYILRYCGLLTQLFIGMFLGVCMGMAFPFLTQALVDFGINSQDINFVYAILLAQLMLFLGRMVIDFIRGWILLFIGNRINISIISDFLSKLMRLPMSFFDTKMVGDILQRITDHSRIESFLTYSTIDFLFSLVNLVVFSLVLYLYSVKIFVVFVAGNLAAAIWILLFMRRRRVLDGRLFTERSRNQSHLVQIIRGMSEIKIGGCETRMRWRWQDIQTRLFRINETRLLLSQYQEAGSGSITELKNIVIIVLSAAEVVAGNMTTGMLLAVSYILGQVNRPIEQLLGFVRLAQDAKLSLERMSEIQQMEDEHRIDRPVIHQLPEDRSLTVRELSFKYDPTATRPVLDNLSLTIPAGRVTAIVGSSGSGKTTLLKLLLKFYSPDAGDITVGGLDLRNFHSAVWRRHCGVVMQDGFLFSDTIANNIALSEDEVDLPRLVHALDVANIRDFVESLPLAYNTRIGEDGHGLSQGQVQRILIARAVYKDPDYLFLDEATSALDARNERMVIESFQRAFAGKTCVIVAHRLSTVRNADQILVLEGGRLIESGTHDELVRVQGSYYHPVKNQLELGS